MDAYALPFAVSMLSAGVLGDRFGSRRAYLLGLAVFAAASGAFGVALFGALVGDTPANIVCGFRMSALISVAPIFVTVVVAWKSIRPIEETGETDYRIRIQIE